MTRKKPKWSGADRAAPPSSPVGKAQSRRRGRKRKTVGQNPWIGRGNPTPETGGHARQRAIKAGRHALCGAIKKNGEPCGNLAGTGTSHKGTGPCRWHGGATPNAQKRAALVLAKEQVGALAPVVPDEDVTEMGHVREALRESVSRLRGWQAYLATLSIEDLLTTEGMFVVDAERKERLAGARVAMYAQSMGLTEIQIRIEQGQWEQLAGAFGAMLDDYHGGHTTHEQRDLWAAVMRKHDYLLDGGSDPDELARFDNDIAAARAAVAGDPEPVDADVVEPEEPGSTPEPADPVWEAFNRQP
jgi:hypothetical protein